MNERTDETPRSLFEHKHDDWRGFQGTSELGLWSDAPAPSIENPNDILPRKLCMVNPNSHLYRAVVSNVAVRLPEYEVEHVYYFYYPDLLEIGVTHITGVQVEIEKRGVHYTDVGYYDQLATIEYQVSITELQGILPLAAMQEENGVYTGRMKEEFAERLQEVMQCPDCMYYRMLHEATLEYLPGREQTNRDVMDEEEAEI